MKNSNEKLEIPMENLTIMDCYLYASCGMKVIIENGVVTGFSPEEEQ